MMMMMTEKEAH